MKGLTSPLVIAAAALLAAACRAPVAQAELDIVTEPPGAAVHVTRGGELVISEATPILPWHGWAGGRTVHFVDASGTAGSSPFRYSTPLIEPASGSPDVSKRYDEAFVSIELEGFQTVRTTFPLESGERTLRVVLEPRVDAPVSP